jgi:nitrogen fixation/metabolism regulation signal transduction histidine kinase
MSEASTARQPARAESTGRHHRSAKNYLLDRHFQLKYTGLLVGIALALSVALGIVLWITSSKVIEQSQRAVEQGRETVKQGQVTVERGKQVIIESRKVSQVVAMTIKENYKDNPDLARQFDEDAAKDEAKLKSEQERLEGEAVVLQRRAEELKQQATELAAQQRTLLIGLIVILALLVVGIGCAGIIFTHKIAGPIFKMKRLLRQVGEHKKFVVREKLRKGDELHHFFEAFEKMVEDLRLHQQTEIARVDEVLARLETTPMSQHGTKEVDAEGILLLKKLRGEMQDQVEI